MKEEMYELKEEITKSRLFKTILLRLRLMKGHGILTITQLYGLEWRIVFRHICWQVG
ncbi:MAG: hypothetical protein ACFWT2_08905 [Thermoanaerobacterium thermosaccharolyticum]|jgi:hypothetical protein